MKTSRFGRLAKIGGLMTHVAGGALSSLAEGWFGGGEGTLAMHRKTAEKLLEHLGAMKGLPMKVGQLVSYMDGAVPEEFQAIYREALGRLQVKATPLAWERMKAELEAALDMRVEEVFEAFDQEPVAAASIGQVYRARLKDGRDVAVKIQYPGIATALTSDLKNVESVVKILKMALPVIDAGTMARDLIARFGEETDYRLEARHQLAFRAAWNEDPNIRIPAVVDHLTRRNVLVTEFHEGQSLASLVKEKDGARRSEVGTTLFRFAFQSILTHGMFHADPHPGNYLFPGGGSVVFLDFGCVQYYDDDSRRALRAVWDALLAGKRAEDLWPVLSMVLKLEREAPSVMRAIITDYVMLCFEPVLAPQPFKFTQRFTRKLSERTMKAKMEVAKSLLKTRWEEPKREGLVHFSRILFGLFSILADLRAEADWRALAAHRRPD